MTSDEKASDSDVEFSDDNAPELEFENSDGESNDENITAVQSDTSNSESEDDEGDDGQHVPPDSLEVIIPSHCLVLDLRFRRTFVLIW